MKFIGIDLAWTYKNETGVCVISENGEIELLSSAILSNEDLIAIIKSYNHEPVCVAIDAPLIVNNENGSRDAERSLMSNKINGFNLSLFTASRNFLTKTYGEIRGEVLLNIILREIPDIRVDTTVIEGKSSIVETFPTAVCCGAFPDIFPVKYKKKVPYKESRYQMKRLLDRLRILEEKEGFVYNLISKLQIDELELTSKNHKHIEDKVDAFLSAYCVYLIHKKIATRMTFGNIKDGFITIPILKNKSIYENN
jgi:predicted RNase H-like nuclease